MTSRPASFDEALDVLARLRVRIADIEAEANATPPPGGLVQDLMSEAGRLADTLSQIAGSGGLSPALVKRIELALSDYVAVRHRLRRLGD